MSVPYVGSILCGSLYTLPLNLLWSHSKKPDKNLLETHEARGFTMFHLKNSLLNLAPFRWIPLTRHYSVHQTLMEYLIFLFSLKNVFSLCLVKEFLVILVTYFFKLSSPSITPSSCSNMRIRVFLLFPFATNRKYLVLLSPSSNSLIFCTPKPFNFLLRANLSLIYCLRSPILVG